ncbi:D-alanyl-D-alanine carboxypeptidase/D-alanyl-D-alanine endopeptidase [Leptonema illini]|uniref:Peptidase S13 D-Ala-D-Ala carboxypeptidase C n=1 Tax=Leptonema illini DSM 21528 TaxID=929563 RepID=H2CA40_9LEPT|nr:D-alanyl-D-alanine carboxypeptidase/D-alanyl-D-alanine-endopeptidase [Leptonema illini]EHQ05164.1 peptidase S13 D-Ala-D-Ala carboxypeptidase C [Leptonema illini DSM 21528]
MRRSRNSILVILLSSISFFAACGKSSAAFEKQLSEAALRPVAAPASVAPETIGYVLFDPATGTVVEEFNRRLPLIPASTTKVLTLGLALRDLGTDYRFKTTLGYNGDLETGDLVLSGGEDPELRVRDLLSLLGQLQSRIGTEWTGRFYYAGEPLFARDRIDESMEAEAAYNPALGSLSLDSNIIYLRWKKTKGSSEAHLVPSLPGIDLSLLNKEPGEEDEREVLYAGQGEGWLLRKPKQPEGMRAVPVKDAGLFTGRVFQRLAATRGVRIPDPQPATTPDADRTLAVHESRPLEAIAEQILATSDNVMTELVLLHLAKKESSRPLPLHEAATFLENQYRSRMPGLDWTGFQLRNGSGLTSGNRITAEQLLASLLYADSINGGIERLLPIGGWTQGMMGRLNRPDEAFRVVAKAGGIYYSVSLTGFVYPKSGRRLAFAIMITDLNRRKAYESANDKLSRRKSNEARMWMMQNREALDGIVSSWISRY